MQSAATSERNTQGYASNAAASATNASGSETNAAASASQAADSASAASTSASLAASAKTDAETAQSAAEDAQTAAETAAQNIQASATQIATNTQNIATNTADIAQNTSDIADVMEDLNELQDTISTQVKSKNLINPNTVVVGRLSSSGGIQENMTGYYTSDYILLKAGKTYVFARESLSSPGTALATSYAGYGLYDTSKVWIADSRVYDNYPAGTVLAITPQNDCYVRVTGGKNYFNTDTVGRYILEEGTGLTGYEEYFEPYDVVTVLKKDDIVQSLGQDEEKLMSQKAVTDNTVGKQEFNDVLPYVAGKNKYNPSDCNPQNGKYYDSSGVVTAGAGYAITGKIPVEAETTYVFSTTLFSNTYTTANYFSGSDGSTFLSKEANNGSPFTTPANCTFVGINLFGRTHTDQDFDDAIAIAQLEIGTTPTTYEPYEKKRMIYPSNIVGGDAIDAVNDVTAVQSRINLYDKSLAMDGKYFNSSSGTISNAADYAFTGKIPVKPNTQYNISKDPSMPLGFSSVVYCFDEAGNRLANATLGGYVYSYLLSFATAADVHFIAVNLNLPSHTEQDFEDTIDTVMLCVGTKRPLAYSAYNPEPVVDADKLSDAYVANRKCFSGKKWLACGTSITWYDGKTYQAGVNTGEICRGYVGDVSRRKGLLVTNEGISGSTLANVSESSLINRYTTLDWANTDIATIEYGVNDYGHAVDVGTAEDAAGNTTFASCLKTIIEYALTQNPKICLVICTEPDVRGSAPNSGGHYLSEYTEVTLAIAKQYRLPVCDWYYQSGINALNKGSSSVDYLTADGTHPNDEGHLRMGAMLNQVFDTLIC